MAKGLNKVMLIGNLANDPEQKTLPSGQNVAHFTVATSETFKDSNGNLQERTEWHRITAWGRLAEICGQYLKKGRQVYIEGRIQTRSWEDPKTQEKRFATEIICAEMQMLGGRDSGSSPEYAQQQSEPLSGTMESSSAGFKDAAALQNMPPVDDEKDDLPF